MRELALVLPLLVALLGGLPSAPVPASGHALAAVPGSAGSWRWPVVGAIVHGYDPPETPFGAGHRGIDIAAEVGTTVVAPASGVVSFAGKVGGQRFVTIDHGSQILSTSSYVSEILVHKGDAVSAGSPIALSGTGHPGSTLPTHLHFGIRVSGEYVDPMTFLAPASVVGLIRLAPLDG
jgi:murein DD-endopeptidase MepM/ murein hydrolase activator NlpD